MRKPAVMIALAASLVGSTSNAADVSLSLREAVARALSDGTAARIAGERVNRAAASAIIERSAMLPTLETSVSGGDHTVNFSRQRSSNGGFNINITSLAARGGNPARDDFRGFNCLAIHHERLIDFKKSFQFRSGNDTAIRAGNSRSVRHPLQH